MIHILYILTTCYDSQPCTILQSIKYLSLVLQQTLNIVTLPQSYSRTINLSSPSPQNEKTPHTPTHSSPVQYSPTQTTNHNNSSQHASTRDKQTIHLFSELQHVTLSLSPKNQCSNHYRPSRQDFPVLFLHFHHFLENQYHRIMSAVVIVFISLVAVATSSTSTRRTQV
jgi:hypothetical protein